MKKIELDQIIRRHQHWKKHDCTGWDTMKADLSKVDLSNLDLSDVDLSGANLAGANLSGTNLSWANLAGANLAGVDMSGTNLSWADLTGANMDKANLHGANLSYANLYGANLSGANLEYADIYIAHFDKKENIRKGITLTKPMKGYKKTAEGVVITAEIPAGAIVFSINGKKCRTNMATITNMAGHKLLHSQFDPVFTYKIGKKIIIPDFDARYNTDCSKGFHFFRTKKEAKEY